MFKVREERTGWRDESLSRWHRTCGWDCPAIDLDFVLVEYDNGIATALIEYKNENCKIQNFRHPSYRAIIDLGEKANIPVLFVKYKSDLTLFKFKRLNSVAIKLINHDTWLEEYEYKQFLYWLRGRQLKMKDSHNLMHKSVEKICANCRHYEFKMREIPEGDFGTWAFCAFFQTYFPNSRGWVPEIGELINQRRKAEGLGPAVFKKPGERTCSHFEQGG